MTLDRQPYDLTGDFLQLLTNPQFNLLILAQPFPVIPIIHRQPRLPFCGSQTHHSQQVKGFSPRDSGVMKGQWLLIAGEPRAGEKYFLSLIRSSPDPKA